MLSLYLSIIENEKNISKFEEIYYTYEKMLFKIAYGITKNYHYAEDATQVAWFSIAERIDKIDTKNTPMLKSYLYTIIKNSCFDTLRERKKIETIIDIDKISNLCSEKNALDDIESHEQYQYILTKISTLSYIYRDVLFLYYVLGLNTKAIAKSLNKDINTIKSRLSRGNKILRKILTEVYKSEQ